MMDGHPLAGRRALVTGAGRGIGAIVAYRLGRLGARVCAAARTLREVEAVAADIQAAGGDAWAQEIDVANEESVEAAFERMDRDGGLDILVNNAGLGLFGRLTAMSLDSWERVMAVNLRGPFLCGRAAMKRMAEAGGGRIVNVGSVVSVKGYADQGAYTASKHGLFGLTKVMAVEGQKDGIIVQIVLPGGVDTGMIGASRPDLDSSVLMAPEDVADAVEFALRQRNNAITDMIQIRRRSSAPFS